MKRTDDIKVGTRLYRVDRGTLYEGTVTKVTPTAVYVDQDIVADFHKKIEKRFIDVPLANDIFTSRKVFTQPLAAWEVFQATERAAKERAEERVRDAAERLQRAQQAIDALRAEPRRGQWA